MSARRAVLIPRRWSHPAAMTSRRARSIVSRSPMFRGTRGWNSTRPSRSPRWRREPTPSSPTMRSLSSSRKRISIRSRAATSSRKSSIFPIPTTRNSPSPAWRRLSARVWIRASTPWWRRIDADRSSRSFASATRISSRAETVLKHRSQTVVPAAVACRSAWPRPSACPAVAIRHSFRRDSSPA